MDKRRRRFVMHDVYFLDDALGVAVFDAFGAAGIALWMGFIAACKKNHIEGEMSYTTEAEGLAVLGLPGLQMVRPNGDDFTLEDFWSLLGDHKVTRRRRSARRLHVVSSRWTEWQVNPRRPRGPKGNSRSDDAFTGDMSDEYEQETGLETDTDTDTDTSLSRAGAEREEREFLSGLWTAFAKYDGEVYVKGGGVIKSRGFFTSAAENRRLAHQDDARRLHQLHPEWTVRQVLDEIVGSDKKAETKLRSVAPPCEVCDGRGIVFNEDTGLADDCACKTRKAS